MFKARLAIPIIGVIAASLLLPGVASANTASVKCDSTGVVFTYNADFGRSKVSTETVNGHTYDYTVPVRQVSTHTWPGVSGVRQTRCTLRFPRSASATGLTP